MRLRKAIGESPHSPLKCSHPTGGTKLNNATLQWYSSEEFCSQLKLLSRQNVVIRAGIWPIQQQPKKRKLIILFATVVFWVFCFFQREVQGFLVFWLILLMLWKNCDTCYVIRWENPKAKKTHRLHCHCKPYSPAKAKPWCDKVMPCNLLPT